METNQAQPCSECARPAIAAVTTRNGKPYLCTTHRHEALAERGAHLVAALISSEGPRSTPQGRERLLLDANNFINECLAAGTLPADDFRELVYW